MAVTCFDSFQEIQQEWEGLLSISAADSLFLTPQWQEVWWDNFGNGNKTMAGFYVRAPEGLVGIASLSRQNDTISFLGNRETFDYNDFMVRPGYEADFFETLLNCLDRQSATTMQLYSLPEGSPTLEYLPEMARQRGYQVEISQEDVAPGLSLPGTWDEYLSLLSRKDRHELRRKFRRLESLESWRWYCLDGADQISARLDDFLQLMRQSREEKNEYMNEEREDFFRGIVQLTAAQGLAKLFFMEIDDAPVSTALCFDYGLSRLLYNSGLDPQHNYYSVGLLLNALCLRDAIEEGKEYFDFLRGSEPYKYHLGGRNRILYQMVVKRS